MTSLRFLFSAAAIAAALGCSDNVESDPGGSGGATGSQGAGGSPGAGGDTGVGGTGGDPCDCDLGAYVPVCGVDGMTYDATCGTECVPVDVACQGECPCADPDCDALQQQYAEQLALAKACNPAVSVEQCTQTVGSDLACQCPTYVNGANAEALSALAALVTQWNAAGCGDGLPPCSCANPVGGFCQPDATRTSGSCVDGP